MSNISDAQGTITITKLEGLSYLEFWKALHDVQHDWYYDFSFDDAQDVQAVNFIGNGRWTFSNNVMNLFEWLASTEKTTKGSVALALQKLKSAEFEIEFSYCDCEPSCAVLYNEVDRCTHHAGEEFSDSTVECIDENSYTYNIDNLINVMGFDPDDVKEYYGCEDE